MRPSQGLDTGSIPVSRSKEVNNIIVVGSINMDIVSQVEALPKPGQGVRSADLKFIPGGKGANQAVAASRLGGSVSLLGKVGNDAFGKSIIKFLRKEKLFLNSLEVSKSRPTATVLIIVDRDGTNMMAGMDGANFDISINQVKSLSINPGDIVLSTFEVPQDVTKYLFSSARKAGAVTILNPSPLLLASPGIFALADYLIMNEHELAFFSKAKKTLKKTDDIVNAIKNLTRKNQVVVVTLGERGLVCLKAGEIIRIRGHKVKAIDTTAAGDSFLGAFVVALSENRKLKECLSFANAAAALSVQKLGASTSLPYRKQLENFLS